MFHHIRSSLRQDEGKIPKPIAVSLRNVMILNVDDASAGGGSDDDRNDDMKWFRRPKHEIGLLPLLKLEVIVASAAQKEMEQEAQDRVVYSSIEPIRHVQPTWEHLEEKITLPGEWWRGGIYKSLTIRITQMVEDERWILFLEAPLHPSKLERLQKGIPSSLPPNALLVEFSDGSTRCTQSLFQILLHRRLVEPSPIENFSRFEDDVFSMLDGVKATPNRVRTESVSALLEPPDFHLVRSMDGFDGSQDDEVTPTELFSEEKEQDARLEDETSERERLLAVIAEEEELLKQEAESLEEERLHLSRMVEEAYAIEAHIQQIQDETKRQALELRREEFRKQAQHMKLVREVQRIYPITIDSQRGYLIRGLRFPFDMVTTAIPDHEISAVLGFCCHLVFMLAKYLSVPLRYRIFYNSSRSAIQSDGTMFLPLFLSRSIDREHLETALTLLGENVDCMLITLGIDFIPKSHILARLKRIYDHVIEGEMVVVENGIH